MGRRDKQRKVRQLMAKEIIQNASGDLRAIVITIGGRQCVMGSPAIVLELGEMRIPGLAIAKKPRAALCQQIIEAINPALSWAACGSDCRIIPATKLPPQQHGNGEKT